MVRCQELKEKGIHDFDDVDFDDDLYKKECLHDFKQDWEEQFEAKLMSSIPKFNREIREKSREKFKRDKNTGKKVIINEIICSREGGPRDHNN